MTGKDSISISISPDSDADGTRSLLDDAYSKVETTIDISVDKMSEQLRAFSEKFGKVVSSITDAGGNYCLDEVKVMVEIGVEGKITLLGSGASASGSAGIELTFKKTS